MAREYTRADDEYELRLMALLEAEGVELLIDENEAPRMTLSDLIGPVSDKMRSVFTLMFGGAQ
jgi:hypothetical protein